jgi:hypothetical protein
MKRNYTVRTIYKSNGRITKTDNFGTNQSTSIDIVKQQVKQVVSLPKKEEIKAPQIAGSIEHITDEQLKELETLMNNKQFGSLKNLINQYAGENICVGCSSANSTAIAIVSYELQKRRSTN